MHVRTHLLVCHRVVFLRAKASLLRCLCSFLAPVELEDEWVGHLHLAREDGVRAPKADNITVLWEGRGVCTGLRMQCVLAQCAGAEATLRHRGTLCPASQVQWPVGRATGQRRQQAAHCLDLTVRFRLLAKELPALQLLAR